MEKIKDMSTVPIPVPRIAGHNYIQLDLNTRDRHFLLETSFCLSQPCFDMQYATIWYHPFFRKKMQLNLICYFCFVNVFFFENELFLTDINMKWNNQQQKTITCPKAPIGPLWQYCPTATSIYNRGNPQNTWLIEYTLQK